jgi:hypothetical protein
MAEQMAVCHPDKIDAVGMMGGAFYIPLKEKSGIAWLSVHSWGDGGIWGDKEIEKDADKFGQQILFAQTPPLWHQKSGDGNYHHSPNPLAFGLVVEFIRSCAELRDANGGVMPLAENWPVSAAYGGKKLFFPSEKFLSMWKMVPHGLPSQFGFADDTDKSGGQLDKTVSYSIPGGTPERIVVFIHDPAYREAVFEEDNVYYLAERGAMVFSLKLGDDYFAALKNIENLLKEVIGIKEMSALPVYVGGSGAGGMLVAVATLKNGSKRIKKITAFNSELDWPFPEFSIKRARERNYDVPLELVYDSPRPLPDATLRVDWKTVFADEAFFGSKWFPLLDTVWLGNCEKASETVLMAD